MIFFMKSILGRTNILNITIFSHSPMIRMNILEISDKYARIFDLSFTLWMQVSQTCVMITCMVFKHSFLIPINIFYKFITLYLHKHINTQTHTCMHTCTHARSHACMSTHTLFTLHAVSAAPALFSTNASTPNNMMHKYARQQPNSTSMLILGLPIWTTL